MNILYYKAYPILSTRIIIFFKIGNNIIVIPILTATPTSILTKL
jgi:hypothetical protein